MRLPLLEQLFDTLPIVVRRILGRRIFVDGAPCMHSIEADGAPYGCLVMEDTSMQHAIERMKETLTG